MQKGTYATFPKSGVDFEDILLKKVNEQAELSPVPGTPTLRNQTSESSVWSQQSSRPSLQDAAPEDQNVSFSSCRCPGLSTLGGLMDLQSALLMTSLFVPK